MEGLKPGYYHTGHAHAFGVWDLPTLATYEEIYGPVMNPFVKDERKNWSWSRPTTRRRMGDLFKVKGDSNGSFKDYTIDT